MARRLEALGKGDVQDKGVMLIPARGHSPHQSSHTVSSVSRALSGVSQSLSGSVQVAFILFDPRAFWIHFLLKLTLPWSLRLLLR